MEDKVPSPTSGGALGDLISEVSDLAGNFAAAFSPRAETAQESDEHEYERLDFGDFVDLAPDVREALAGFVRSHLSPGRVLLRDKLSFMLGSLDLLVSAYWLGAAPQSFYRLYTAKVVVLMALRWVYYRWKHWHYYMLDWCYVAQVLLLLNVWVWPSSIQLTKVLFAYSFGPLAWSIVAFRNSLVYHSLDKVTSHFLHWFPACVCWATRWYPPGALRAKLESSPAAAAEWERADLWSLGLLPMLPYLIWATLYYIKVFVISSKKISEKGYETLFVYVTRSRRSLFGRVVLCFPRALQPLVYMAMHLCLTATTLALAALWWRSRLVGGAFILGIFTASAWTGATYYFDVFAKSYVAGLGLERQSQKAQRDRVEHEDESTAHAKAD